MPSKKKTTARRQTGRSVDFAAVRAISDRVRLDDIQVVTFSAQAMGPLSDLSARDLNQTIRVRGDLVGSSNEHAGVMILTEYAASDASEEVARVNLTLMVSYSLRDGANWEDLPQDAVDQFAEINGIYNTWSYIREFIGSSMSRLGLSGVLLPLWRPPAVLPPKGEFSVFEYHAGQTADRQ